jgi:hypothetical protein
MPTTITTVNRLPQANIRKTTYGFIEFEGKKFVLAVLAIAVLMIGATAYLEQRTFPGAFDASIAPF